MSGKVTIISGYFNPIHSGHIDYIASARNLGDYLVVIVNNDNQVKMKGSIPFMSQHERLEIVRNIKGVDRAVISIDEDQTVCQTIRQEFYRMQDDPFLCSISFANGGDRKEGGVPEDVLTDEIGVRMVYNVGGEKTQSSSSLIDNSTSKTNEIGCSKCDKNERKWEFRYKQQWKRQKELESSVSKLRSKIKDLKSQK